MSGAAVVLAPPLDSYPPLSVVREPDRFVVRVEACACGGRVVQVPGEDVPTAVDGHNRTAQHAGWRREQGL